MIGKCNITSYFAPIVIVFIFTCYSLPLSAAGDLSNRKSGLVNLYLGYDYANWGNDWDNVKYRPINMLTAALWAGIDPFFINVQYRTDRGVTWAVGEPQTGNTDYLNNRMFFSVTDNPAWDDTFMLYYTMATFANATSRTGVAVSQYLWNYKFNYVSGMYATRYTAALQNYLGATPLASSLGSYYAIEKTIKDIGMYPKYRPKYRYAVYGAAVRCDLVAWIIAIYFFGDISKMAQKMQAIGNVKGYISYNLTRLPNFGDYHMFGIQFITTTPPDKPIYLHMLVAGHIGMRQNHWKNMAYCMDMELGVAGNFKYAGYVITGMFSMYDFGTTSTVSYDVSSNKIKVGDGVTDAMFIGVKASLAINFMGFKK